MRRPRPFLGTMHPGTTWNFALLPDDTGGETGTGGQQQTPPPANPGGESGTGNEGNTDKGFPADKPVADMSTEQQAAYWKHHARKHEATARESYEWRKANESKVKQYDALEQASKTEQEKAVEAARNDAVKAGRAEAVPQILAAELRASSGGSIDVDTAQKRVQYLDKSAFLAPDGTVDMTKIADWVKDQVGEQPRPGTRKLPDGFPHFPQGQQHNQPVTGKDAGLAEARKRFGTPAAAQHSA
jgi:hypothetical protein